MLLLAFILFCFNSWDPLEKKCEIKWMFLQRLFIFYCILLHMCEHHLDHAAEGVMRLTKQAWRI